MAAGYGPKPPATPPGKLWASLGPNYYSEAVLCIPSPLSLPAAPFHVHGTSNGWVHFLTQGHLTRDAHHPVSRMVVLMESKDVYTYHIINAMGWSVDPKSNMPGCLANGKTSKPVCMAAPTFLRLARNLQSQSNSQVTFLLVTLAMSGGQGEGEILGTANFTTSSSQARLLQQSCYVSGMQWPSIAGQAFPGSMQ